MAENMTVGGSKLCEPVVPQCIKSALFFKEMQKKGKLFYPSSPEMPQNARLLTEKCPGRHLKGVKGKVCLRAEWAINAGA